VYSSTDDVRYAVAPGSVGRDSPATAGSLNDEQIIDAINEADSIVNLHVAGRYVVEQDPANVAVATAPFRYWSRNIAAWMATLSQRLSKPVDVNDPVRLRYIETMALLVKVREGNLDIPGATPVSPSTTGDDVFVYNQYEGHLFGLNDLGLSHSPLPETGLWLGRG